MDASKVDHPIVSAQTARDHVSATGASSLIDVRTAVEVRAEHVPGSTVIPLDDVASRVDEIRALAPPRLLLCRTGRRAESARQQLARLGVEDVCVVEGGIAAWSAAGGQTVRSDSGMSLERQVRIAAGLLIVIGSTLGFAVHPSLHLLSTFVGAGLVFAGATDRCGMALLLANLPWNRGVAAAAQPTES